MMCFMNLYRIDTTFDTYIVKARTENKAKELVWIVEANVTGNSWEDEYDVQELDIDNMNTEEVISGGS